MFALMTKREFYKKKKSALIKIYYPFFLQCSQKKTPPRNNTETRPFSVMAASASPTTAEHTLSMVNKVIDTVAAKAAEWASLGAASKLSLLKSLLVTLEAERDNWAEASVVGHGYDSTRSEQGHLVGETYIVGPAMFGMWVHAIMATYEVL